MRRSLRSWVAAVPVAVALLVACTDSAPPPVPRPATLEGVDARVVELIERTVGQVEADPSDVEAWAKLGMVYQANEMWGASRIAYEFAVSRRPNDPKWWHRLAQVREMTEDLEGAIAAMSRSIELEDRYAPSFWRRGDWLMDRGELDRAEEDFRRAMVVAPEDPQGAVGLGRLLLERDQPEEAARVLEQALERVSDDPYAHTLLGTAYRQLGRLEEAEAHLRRGTGDRFIRTDPWATDVARFKVGFGSRVLLATLYLREGEIEAATAILEKLRTEDPADARVLAKLGQAYMMLGRNEEALTLLDDAVRRHPNTYSVLLEHGAALQLNGRPDDALLSLGRAIEVKPEGALAHFRRGMVLKMRQQHAAAAESFETALRYEPNDVAALKNLADCRGFQDRWTDAAAGYERAIGLDDDDPELFARLGYALFRLQQLEAAETALERSMQLGPRQPDAVGGLLMQVRRLRTGGGGSAAGDAG